MVRIITLGAMRTSLPMDKPPNAVNVQRAPIVVWYPILRSQGQKTVTPSPIAVDLIFALKIKIVHNTQQLFHIYPNHGRQLQYHLE